MTSTRSSREERKNSSFRRVFWWSMGYNRIITIFYTFFLLGVLPVGVLLSIMGNQGYYSDMSQWKDYTAAEVAVQYGESIRQSFNVQMTTFVIPISMLFLLVWCARNFGYMQGRRSVDLFHSLPVRRTPLFMGSYMAGLVSTLVPVALSVGLTQLLCAVNNVGGVMSNPGLFWEAFGVTALPLAAAMTFTVFFMVVSGNPLNWFLMTVAVALGWPVVMLLCDQTMSAFLPGYVSVMPGILYMLLSPYFAAYLIIPNGFYYLSAFLLANESTSLGDAPEHLYDIPLEYVLWWVVFTLAMLALTLFYYGRRKSECAENPFSFPAARGAVRSLMTVGGSLGLGLVIGTLLDSNLAYLIGLIVGAVVAHTVFQAVITRGFRRFWMTIPAFAVTAALIGGGLYALYTGGLGYVKRTPDPDQVALANFTLPDVAGDESKECYLAISTYGTTSLTGDRSEFEATISPSFREKEEVECLAALHLALLEKYPGPYLPFEKKIDSNTARTFTVTYSLKNGGALKRDYLVPIYREDEVILGALAETQKLPGIQCSSPFYSTQARRVSGLSVYQSTKEYEYNASASNDELTPEQREQIWSTFVAELNSTSFRNPAGLMTREESQAETARQNSGEEYNGRVDEKPSYIINVGAIPMAELEANTKAYVEREYEGKTLITGLDGCSYTVPECCVKTRALIDEMTKDNGSYYYYDQDEDSSGDDSAPAYDPGVEDNDQSQISGVLTPETLAQG